MEETWATLERRLWLPEHGLYAEEADENWRVDPYRSESGNLHMTEERMYMYTNTLSKLEALLIRISIPTNKSLF